jgi:hypothetical protein
VVKHPLAFQSISTEGLYPAGEGAGYAGGIMSAGDRRHKGGGDISWNLSEKSKFMNLISSIFRGAC